ncbi:hypothetical protein [Microbacterium phage MO526]|uniref:Capsid maturation protease n=1 Tax=Microbacterium phage MO526 TaxID=3108092 RepID=A0ABZ0ZXB2_9CAUD|nr:hypothetical protein [Microbacterium phage MO526]
MSIFDALRQADARRRLDSDVTALTAYARRQSEASTAFALAVADPPAEVEASDEAMPTTARWAGPIGMEDEMTGDARLIEGGALRWEVSADAPLPMRYVRSDVGAHDGAEVVGSILSIERRPGGVIWAEGDFDMTTDGGREAYRAVRDKRQNGVSMDLDDVSFEIRVAGELFDAVEAMFEDEPEEGAEPAEEDAPERDDEGRVTVAKINSDDEVMVTTDARVRASTIVAVPAFANARIDIADGEATAEEAEAEEAEALVAAAAPLLPPAAWFAKADLDGPTALTVTKDGRVYGHLAVWGTCHISHSAGGKCVTPPNSPSDYAWFHTGALETAEGEMLSVGHLTMNTGHAGDGLDPAATLAHYDNTGTVAADVRAYEDQWGIQVVGGLRSTLSGEQVRAFRAAPLSGDWRRVGNALELVGALSVNVPGFGVPRPHGKVRQDNLVSLVASGIIVPVDEDTAQGLSSGDIAYLRSFIDRSKRTELAGLAARRNRVKVATFARRRKG